MSGGQDKDSKTEKPTRHKLREARKKGQVARSEEVTPTIVFIFAFAYFYFAWDWFTGEIKEMFDALHVIYAMEFKMALKTMVDLVMTKVVLTLMLPFSIMMMLAGIIGNMVQFGFVFSVDPIIPKGSKIDPVSGFKRVFSIKQVVKTVFSIIKIVIMTIVLYFLVRWAFREYVHDIVQCNVDCKFEVFQALLSRLLIILIPILIFLMFFDVFFQKQQHEKDQMMTKDEVKREFKNIEGDPLIKGMRMSEARRMSQEDMKAMIKESRVLIVGMGSAIALKYDEEMPLPIILAIGKEKMGYKMLEIAKRENVATVSDPQLVTKLLDEGKIDQYIPSSTVKQVAKAISQARQGG